MTDLSHDKTKYLLARVSIPSVVSLGALARQLNAAFTGLNLIDDADDRFDEVPASVMRNAALEFVLLGDAEEQPSTEYEFKFRCKTDLSIDHLLSTSEARFLSPFIRLKQSDTPGYFDYSAELAHFLTKVGIKDCEPICPTYE